MVLSLEWAFFGNNKQEVLFGVIFVGVAISFLIGVPLLLILRYYEYSILIWLGLIFAIIVFSIATYSLYKAGCKRLKMEK
jgi:hypothetical protein